MEEENVIGKYKQPEKNLSQKVDQLLEIVGHGGLENIKKPKAFRMPFKGKLGRTKLKRGFVTVIQIAENDAVSFTREVIEDGTIRLDKTYHAVDDQDILTYKGRPLIIVPKKSNTPYNPNRVINNTYGQKHIQSRMLNETINTAKKLGFAGMSIGAVVLIGALIYAFVGG